MTRFKNKYPNGIPNLMGKKWGYTQTPKLKIKDNQVNIELSGLEKTDTIKNYLSLKIEKGLEDLIKSIEDSNDLSKVITATKDKSKYHVNLIGFRFLVEKLSNEDSSHQLIKREHRIDMIPVYIMYKLPIEDKGFLFMEEEELMKLSLDITVHTKDTDTDSDDEEEENEEEETPNKELGSTVIGTSRLNKTIVDPSFVPIKPKLAMEDKLKHENDELSNIFISEEVEFYEELLVGKTPYESSKNEENKSVNYSYISKDDILNLAKYWPCLYISGAKITVGNAFSTAANELLNDKEFFTFKVEGDGRHKINNKNSEIPRMTMAFPCPPYWKPAENAQTVVSNQLVALNLKPLTASDIANIRTTWDRYEKPVAAAKQEI